MIDPNEDKKPVKPNLEGDSLTSTESIKKDGEGEEKRSEPENPDGDKQ